MDSADIDPATCRELARRLRLRANETAPGAIVTLHGASHSTHSPEAHHATLKAAEMCEAVARHAEQRK